MTSTSHHDRNALNMSVAADAMHAVQLSSLLSLLTIFPSPTATRLKSLLHDPVPSLTLPHPE